MNVVINRSKRKTLSIRVKDHETIIVQAPTNFPIKKIDEILSIKKSWINKKVAQLEEVENKYRTFCEGKEILLSGEIITVAPSDKNNFDKDARTLYLDKKTFDNKLKRLNACSTVIENYANVVLPKVISNVSVKLNFQNCNVSIARIRGKRIWGKCLRDNSIVIDYRVAQLPLNLQEYIVVHEFCHLFEFNHSKKFWNTVEHFLPNSNELKIKQKKYDFFRELY